MKTWRGRIYCKVLYALAGGKEAWLALKKRLHGFLVILDEWQMKKCRQWGWSQKVLDRVSSMQHASKEVAVLLVGVGEEEGKKRVLVEATALAMHNGSTLMQDHSIVTTSKPNDAWSYEFNEK